MPENKPKITDKPVNDIVILPEINTTAVDKSIQLNNPSYITDTIGNTLFGESKYDDLSINPEFVKSGDFNFIRGEKQSSLSQLGLGVLRAVSKAGIEAAKTPGYIYSLGEWGASNYNASLYGGEGINLSDALDNVYLNKLEDLDEGIKETLPVYKSYKSGKGGIVDNIMSTSFWASDGADGIGYLLGMIAPGYILGKLGTAAKFAQMGSSVKTAQKLELGTQTLLNTSIESLAESKQVADNLKSQDIEPDKIAEAARNTFYANMGLLLIPNAIMNKNLLGRFSKDKSLLDNFRDASGKLVSNPIAKKQLLKEYSKSIGTAAITEGFIEEGGQNAIQNYEQNKALSNTSKDWLEGVANEYLNTLTTTEGQKAIVLGAVLGGLGGARSTYKENKNLKEFEPTLKELIDNNFEGFSIDNDIYKRDNSGTIIINPETNHPEIDVAKTTEVLKNYISETKDATQSDLAAFSNDKTLHDKIVNDQFTRYALPFIQQGEVGLEVLNEYIDNASDTQHLLNESELANSKDLDFDENKYKTSLKKKAKDLQNIYEDTKTIVNSLDFLDKLEGNKELLPEYNNRLLNVISQENSKQLFYLDKIKELTAEVLNMRSGISIQIPQNQIIANKLQSEIDSLANLLEKSKEYYNTLFDPKQNQEAFNYFQKNKESLDKLNEKIEKEDKKPEVTKEDFDIANEKYNLADSILKLYDSKDLNSFDSLYDQIKNNSLLTKEDKKSLLEHRKSLIPENTEAKDLFESVGLTIESIEKPFNYSKDQEDISTFINDPINYNGDSQLNLFEGTNILNEITDPQRGIDKRNNVVMMHLFNHQKFDKSGNFKFERNDDGYPIIDNNSKLDIKELNSVQVDNIVNIQFVSLSKGQLEDFNKQKQQSLKDSSVLDADFDNEHLGIFSNNKLIGFVQQPHTSKNAENQDLAEQLRQDLIEYRRDVIGRLRSNEEVTEVILEKGNGNLYTKLKDNGRIDPINNVLNNSRAKDHINNALLFVYSNGENLIIPTSTLSNKQEEEFNEILGNFNKYGKKGQVFQLVKDLMGSWSPIPIYSSLIDDLTADNIIQVLSTYTDQNNPIELVKALDDYIYTSANKERANLYITNKNGPIQLYINGNMFFLNDILTNKVRINAFKEELKTKRQNINITNLNNKNYQDSLKERNTLITNVLPYQGEYFVQPYIEYTHGGIIEATPVTEDQIKELTTNQKDTDLVKTDKDRMEELGISEEDLLSSDDALSRTYDSTELNRNNIRKWLDKNLPQLTLSDITNIVDLKINISDAYGLYKDLNIYLFEGAGNKTAYHEAFHGVFRNMLDLNKKKELIKEAIIKYKEPTRDDLNFLQKGLIRTYNENQLKYLYYEEKLADDFANYTDIYNNRSIVGKIKDFFNKILSFFNLYTKNPSKTDELFNRINTKQFKSKSIKNIKLDNIEVVNRDFEVFNDEYAYSRELDKVFGTAIKSKLVQSLGNQFLSLYNDELNQVLPGRPLHIYQKIIDKYNKFINEENHTKDEYIFALKIKKNYPQLTKEINKYLSYRGVIVNEDIIVKPEAFTEESLDDNEITMLRSQTTKGFGDWTSVSGLSSASTRLKLFLSSIPVLNEDKTTKKDVFGIEQFYDFTKLYYYIERNLTDIYTFENQLESLKELSINNPALIFIIDKLTNKSSNITKEQFEILQNDFKTNFSKQQLAYTLVKFDTNSATGEVKYRIIDANRQGFVRETIQEWQNNLLDPSKDTIADFTNINEVKQFGTIKAKQLLDKWNLLLKINKFNYEEVNKVLNKAGVEYSKDVLKDIIKDNSNRFKTNIRNLLTWYASDKPVDLEEYGRKSLKALVEIEAKANFDNFTSSFNNVESKNIYTIQLPSYTSRLLAKLKSDNFDVFKNTLEEFKRDPFYKFNNLLEEFETDNKFRNNEFRLTYLDGLKDEKGESKGSKFTNMTPKDFMSMQIALFQNKTINTQKTKSNILSKYIYLTPSDKTMSMLFNAKRYDLDLEEDGRSIKLNSNSDTNIVTKFYNVFLSESHRIKHNLDIKNDILTNKNNSKYSLDELIEHYHSTKSNFSKLSKYAKKQLNNQELTDKDWEDIESLFDGQAYKFNYFSQTFTKNIDNLFKVIEESKIEDLENNLDSIRDQVVLGLQSELNKEIASVRKEMLEKGLIYSYITPQGTKLYGNITLDLDSKSQQDIHSEINKLIASYSTNSLLHNIELSNLLNGDYALYKPNDLQKRTYQSQSMITNNNFIGKIIKTILVKDVEIDLSKEGLLILGFTEEEASYISEQYKDINVTDAQVYITPEFYKKINLSRGTWGLDEQLAYDIAESIIDPKTIDKSLRVKLGGIKPFYFGNRFDDKLGIQKYEQVKCAMLPLFKSYTDFNPLLKAKREEMENIGASMLAHESSFKATIGFRDNITSDNYLVLDLDTNNFGIQVDNPEHTIDTENDSMRQLKMLLIGSIDPSKEYKGALGKDIIDNILVMEAANIRESMKELNRKIDIKSNIDFTKFVKDMVTKRGATSNIEEILNIVDGDFEYPLDNGNLSTQIENMISSIFTNNVIKQSFEGGSLVQATSLGLKFRNLEEQQENLSDDALLLQQELKWIKPNENSIKYAECIMPAWSSQFFNGEGKLKDINNISDELRQLITYRIPTEGLHSMLPIKVVKFLPETIGNFILLPYEVTKQLGADFDFDKLYFINKQFYKDTKDGTIVDLTPYRYIYGDTKEDSDNRFYQYLKYVNENKLDLMDRDDFNELSVEEQNVKAARNNRIVDNYLHLLTSRENLNLLTKPSGFEKLLKLKDLYFRDYQKHNFFSSRTQRDFKERNHIGIALKGQSALHVSGHSYSVLMPLNTESYTENGFLDTTKTINFNNENKFNFNNIYTDDNELIADELSSIMAAILDDIKNPILEPLGINKNTIDVLATIIRSGYNINTAIKFIAQPGIKHLSNLLDTNQNKIKDIGQGWNDPRVLINRYEHGLAEDLDALNNDIKEDPSFSSLIELSKKQTSNILDDELDYYLKNDYSAENKTFHKGTYNMSQEDIVLQAKYYAFQIRVLKNFSNISNIAKELVEINKFFGINKEVGPNIENIISKQELLNNINNSEIVKGFDINLIPPLKATYEAHRDALDFFENYFPYSTEYYNTIKQALVSYQTSKKLNQIPIEDRSFINSFIRYYTDNNFTKFNNINSKYENLFVTLPKLLKNIKTPNKSEEKLNNVTYEQIKNNLFINNLKIVSSDSKNNKYLSSDERRMLNTGSKIFYIQLKGNKLDLQVKNNLIESFIALYNNKSTQQLALDLIDHSFVSTGLFTGIGSYANLISPIVLKEIGYMSYRKELIENINNDMVSLNSEEIDRLIDQLVRNNPKPFTKVFDSDMFNIDKDKTLPNKISTSEELINISNRSIDMILSDGRLPKYIRVYDKISKKALIYKNITDTMNYTYINNLGKKGYMIEVNPNENLITSFLKENNTLKPVIEDKESNDELEQPTLESNEYNFNNDPPINLDIESRIDQRDDNPSKEDDNDLPNNIKPC